jgi:hypothetical protein
MIAFGASITVTESYRRYADPGIRMAAEPDSEIYSFAATGPIARSYNLLLDTAGARDDLEALVLVHPHLEIADPGFCDKVRRALEDPEVAVVGCVGATGVDSIAWWEGSVSRGPVVHRYEELGGGELPAFAWTNPAPAPAEAETVDGFLLVLSPWAVRNVRFDETLTLGHGFDLDYCLSVRAAGGRIMTADLACVYHRALEIVTDTDLGAWREAHLKLAEKWDGRMPGADASEGEPDWKARARRAEAECEAARAVAYANTLIWDARVLDAQRRLDRTVNTLSWQVTAPLRRGNVIRGRLGKRLRNGRAGSTPAEPVGPRL